MGTAIANKIDGAGFEVSRWNRNGIFNAESKAKLVDSLSGASILVLSLYDGKACIEVSEQVLANLEPDALVLNTSTVGLVEAQYLNDLFTAHNATYVQAPLMGSVPAIEKGLATIILGGSPAAIKRALPITQTFSQAHIEFDLAAEAAAAKLISNHALADALLSIRQALVISKEMGLPTDRVLDVLELGPLAPMVKGKRVRLEGQIEFASADSTLAALIKDLELAAAASPAAEPSSLKLQALLHEFNINPDSDIAELPRSAIT